MRFRFSRRGIWKGVSASCCLLAATGFTPVALADEPSVPLYTPEEALRLGKSPISRMLGGGVCERIDVVRYRHQNNPWSPVAGADVALFRKGNRRHPFMQVVTREDGVYVARFPAQPGEVIYSRAFIVDPASGRRVYGKESRLICMGGKVDVGAPVPIDW